MVEGANDKKNRRIAFIVSVGLHVCLFLTFFFLISWRAPYPPAPEYGVVLNYGVDDQGSGDIQPNELVGDNSVTDKNNETLKSKEKIAEAEPVVEEQKQNAGIVSDESSDVPLKEETKKAETKPKKNKTIAKKKLDEENKPTINEAAVYAGDKGIKQGETNQSQGDDLNKLGDKGNPQGKLDAKALYGKAGGGGGGNGFGLAMTGWEWTSKPKTPILPDDENGIIEFEITCDENGDIIKIKTLQRGLSPQAEQILKGEIQKNSLTRTSDGKVPEKSKGKVVFVLKTK